jgi:hypothetical protein
MSPYDLRLTAEVLATSILVNINKKLPQDRHVLHNGNTVFIANCVFRFPPLIHSLKPNMLPAVQNTRALRAL